MIWYGSAPTNHHDSRVLIRSDTLPEQRISQFSHMAVLFAPDNAIYGVDASERFCENGQGQEDEQRCRNGAEVWYSAWGYREAGKIHARLTFNPYFDWQMKVVVEALKLTE